MNLVATALKPSISRAPYFDGWETELASYRFKCALCSTEVLVPFSAIRDGAFGWRERFAPEEAESIAAHFQLGEAANALESGWPSISTPSCPNCQSSFVFYAAFDEYRHSGYKIVAQGLSVCGA